MPQSKLPVEQSSKEEPSMTRIDAEAAGTPSFIEINSIFLDGTPSRRLLIVFRSNGCRHDACTMCGYTRELPRKNGPSVKARHLIRQFQAAISAESSRMADVGRIDLLIPGSFLDDLDVPPAARLEIFRRISEMPGIQNVLIESRAEFVTETALLELRRELRPGQQLELAVGVESANPRIRNDVLNKSLRWEDLERVVQVCAKTGAGFQAYLLIKPPSLTEAEAIEDAAESARQVAALAGKWNAPFRISFQPVFIPRGTPLEELHEAGRYETVNLWSVVEVIRRTHSLGPIFVGLNDENLSGDRKPSSCPACSAKIVRALEIFNAHQSVSALETLDCPCRRSWRESAFI